MWAVWNENPLENQKDKLGWFEPNFVKQFGLSGPRNIPIFDLCGPFGMEIHQTNQMINSVGLG